MKIFDFSRFEAQLASLGTIVLDAVLDGDYVTEFASWDHFRLIYARSGNGRLDLPDRQVVVPEAQFILLPPGTDHRWCNRGAEPLVLFIVCIQADVFARLPAALKAHSEFLNDFPRLVPTPVDGTAGPVRIESLFNAIREEKKADRSGAQAAILGQVLQLMVACNRACMLEADFGALSPRDAAVARSLDHLHARIHKPIGIKDLAAIARLSYRRYTDVFKARTGMTVNQYINNRRIALAKRELLETGNILYASLESGFGDLANFYRVFRKLTGLTPRQYIEKHTAANRPGVHTKADLGSFVTDTAEPQMPPAVTPDSIPPAP